MATIAPADEFGAAKRHTAEFFFARLLPRALALAAAIDSQSAAIMDDAGRVILIWRPASPRSGGGVRVRCRGQGCR